MKRRFIGDYFWGNCFIVSFNLWLNNKAKAFGVLGKAHFICKRKSGRIIHFKALNKNLPFWKKLWFKGRLELISDKVVRKTFRRIL